MHQWTTAMLKHVRRRQKRLDVMLRIRQIRQIHQIPVQRHVVRHALVRFAHVLEVLDGLDESRVLIQNLLDVHRAWRRSTTAVHWTTGTAAIARIWRLLRLLLLGVCDRHVCFLFGVC